VQGGPIPPSGTTGGEAFATGKPVFVNESNLERFMQSEYFRKGWDAGLRSGGNVPLIAHGRTLGVMGLASFRENAFTDDDIDLLCRVASQIALAVENSLNYEKARDAERELKLRLDQLHLLLEVTNNVTSNLGLRELFKAITECLAKVVRFDGLGLSIYDEASAKLRILAIEQVPNPDVRVTSPLDEGQLIDMEGTPPGIVFKSRKTHVFTRICSATSHSERWRGRRYRTRPARFKRWRWSVSCSHSRSQG
jgi:formate hydrogenlyase transcriptional activator